MNHIALAEPRIRTLANVLLEIGHADLESQRCDRMCANTDSPEAEQHWADRGAEADQRHSELCDEARVMIERATGCSWEQIYEALA